ncbi:unnamed protein product [Allacma fusca]|uniref:Uncharacterized protein n=1 Tax=Allacma fusca TaxID=39272 RepID=A0A8J2NYU4_9HEXA|nr:unnamed protein product [Allacma fusca]
MAADRIVVSEFGTAAFPDPCKTIFQRFQTKFRKLSGKDLSDSCSVSVGYYGDQLYAMTETNAIRRIEPMDLKTIGGKTLISDFVAINHATAHPHVSEDGTAYNMENNYRHKKGPHYVVVKIPPTFGSVGTCFNQAKIIAEIPVTNTRFPSYYHSFGITKDKLIFIESPWRLDLLKTFKTFWTNQSLDSTIVWKPILKQNIYDHFLPIKNGGGGSIEKFFGAGDEQ